MAAYLLGVDIGGTFTDCVAISVDGEVVTSKAPSTPDDYARGVLDAIEAAAGQLGLSLDTLCGATNLLSHATTIGTNAVIEKRGAKVGLITTRGHEDVIHIMRGARGLSGREITKLVHFPESSKPDPIVPKSLIEGVSERIDCFGVEVVPLNEAEVREAVTRLVTRGVEAIAISFLWSFKAPAHERRAKAIIAEMAPDIFVCCSSDLAPKWGEYERTTAAVLNAYVGPLTSRYLERLSDRFKALGYRRPLQIAQCSGGTVSVTQAIEAPLLTLDSGPVAGVTGSRYLGELMGYDNIITTDMGGTSFDVGLIVEGELASSSISKINQYDYFLPKVDINVIGAGGGSLVDVDAVNRLLRVGPKSAGAMPGPVCYGRGGTQATVTDAALVLGYLNPHRFAGERHVLDVEKATAAVQYVAHQLDMSLERCAAGIAMIAEYQMADLIRKATVQRGIDPRDFVVFAFGGAGPLHASVFAFEAGAEAVIVPQKKLASTWCAFGAAAADILHLYEKVDIQSHPHDPARIRDVFAELSARAKENAEESDEIVGDVAISYSVDIRHQGQINEVEVQIEEHEIEDITGIKQKFYEKYAQIYGRGTSYDKAPLELVTFRVRARQETPKPRLKPAETLTGIIPTEAVREARSVYWTGLNARVPTRIFDAEAMLPGNAVEGPAILETVDTTIVVHPDRIACVDRFGNIEIKLKVEQE